MRDAAKEERTACEEKIRKLRKGRVDLLKAYKQQIILIDNLRRQNICLEKAKALEIAEKEFLKVLDWNFADKWNKTECISNILITMAIILDRF